MPGKNWPKLMRKIITKENDVVGNATSNPLFRFEATPWTVC